MSDKEQKPHDSALLHTEFKNKPWYKMAFGLFAREKEKSRGQWVLLGMLVIFAVVGGSMLGLALDTNVLNPPLQVVGQCPPPAYIAASECWIRTTTTNSQGSEQIIVHHAGTILGAPNP